MRRISGLLSGIPATQSVAPAMTVPAVPAAKFDRVLSFNIVAIALEIRVRNDQPDSSCSRCIWAVSVWAKRACRCFRHWVRCWRSTNHGLKAFILAREILESDDKQLPHPGKEKSC